MDYLDIYKFAYDAYKGSGGFINGGYLDKYPRESEEKFIQRKEIAYYENIFAPKINRYIGYIFKSTPTRTSKNKLIKTIFDNVDNQGNSADVFFSNFAKNAKVKGVNLLLVDAPKELGTNLQEQLQKRYLPYFVEIEPERIAKYKLDNNKFEFIAFYDTIDKSTFEKTETLNIIRYFDKNEWRIYDEDYKLLKKGEHNLGVCPVLIFSESGKFLDVGEFTQIAFLAKRHYNLLSELDEILRGETFPILTLNADNPGDVELKIASDNAIVYQTGMNKPEFIAPPSAPAEIYLKKIKDLENQIDKIAYDISTNENNESGIALDLKFQGLNASLSNFSLRLEDLERRAFDVVCKYLNITNDININYAKNFSIIDTNKEIEVLSEMKNLITSPTYFKLKTLQIISNDLNSIEPDEFAKIVSEVEDEGKK